MKHVKSILAILAALTMFACGDEDAGPTKTIFSSWVEDGTGFILNLSSFGFNATYPASFIVTAGGTCDCNAYMTGDESSGAVAISACAYNGGGSDPGCAAILNGNYTYTKSGVVLTLCKPSTGDCGTYH